VVAGGGPCRAMPVNPDAPDDMRTKRLRSWHEGGRNRSRAPANPLHQESPQKAAPLPAPQTEARQPILSAAVTGQTLGQQSKAKMAVARAARKKAAIAAKETGLAQGRLRMPLSDLVVESAAATGRATTSVPFPAAAAPQNWLLQQLETARPATVAVAQVQSGGDFGPGGASLLAAAHVGTTLPQTLASGGTQSTSPPVIKAAAAHGRGHKRERKATRAQQLYEEQENLEF